MVFTHPLFVFLRILEEDLRVGAVLREQNALPTTRLLGVLFAAKDAIDNGGAGRAAKSATPTTSTNFNPNRIIFSVWVVFYKKIC